MPSGQQQAEAAGSQPALRWQSVAVQTRVMQLLQLCPALPSSATESSKILIPMIWEEGLKRHTVTSADKDKDPFSSLLSVPGMDYNIIFKIIKKLKIIHIVHFPNLHVNKPLATEPQSYPT